VSTPQGSWNFGWPVAIAIVAVVGSVLVLAAMDKLPTEMFGVRWATQSPTPLSPAAVNGSVDQPSIRSTSIPPTQVEFIPSPPPSLTSERTGVVDDVDGSSNLRSSPNLGDATNILTGVSNGTSVTILEEFKTDSDQVWYRVQVGEKIGWMNKKIIRVD